VWKVNTNNHQTVGVSSVCCTDFVCIPPLGHNKIRQTRVRNVYLNWPTHTHTHTDTHTHGGKENGKTTRTANNVADGSKRKSFLQKEKQLQKYLY